MRTEIQTVLARHPGLLHRARFVRMHFEIRSSAARMRVNVDGPQIGASMLEPGSSGDSPDFFVEADEAAWKEYSRATPQPEFHDLMALLGAGHARFEGDGLSFYRNLFLVKGIIAAVFRGEATSW